MKNSKNLALYIVGAIAVLALPLLLQMQGCSTCCWHWA
jgi:branched-chain amino acid transport system permease protein